MRRLALAVVVGGLAVPATAAAAAPPVPVATATAPDGTTATLLARPRKGGICLTLARASHRTHFGCLPLPTAESEADEIGAGNLDEHTAMVVGVARPATKAIALRFRRPGRRVTIPTVAAPGPWAGKARFYLGLLRPPAPIYARLLAADGHVRVASDIDPFARPPVRGPRRLARLEVGSRPLRLSVVQRSFLDPRRGHPEHRQVDTCLRLSAPTSGDESCGLPPRHFVDFEWSGSCGNGPLALYGVLPRRAASVELGLRHGRTQRVRTKPLPTWPHVAGRRYFAVAVAHARAVRRLVALDRNARRIAGGRPHLGRRGRGFRCGGGFQVPVR
jgi:hypothetical protein